MTMGGLTGIGAGAGAAGAPPPAQGGNWWEQYVEKDEEEKKPAADKVLSTRTVSGVTYKAYQRADGSLYTLNVNSGEAREGGLDSFGINDKATTSSSASSSTSKAATGSSSSGSKASGASGGGGAAPAPDEKITYRGDMAYRVAPNGALSRAPEYDLEGAGPPKNVITTEQLQQEGAQVGLGFARGRDGTVYRQNEEGSWEVSSVAPPKKETAFESYMRLSAGGVGQGGAPTEAAPGVPSMQGQMQQQSTGGGYLGNPAAGQPLYGPTDAFGRAGDFVGTWRPNANGGSDFITPAMMKGTLSQVGLGSTGSAEQDFMKGANVDLQRAKLFQDFPTASEADIQSLLYDLYNGNKGADQPVQNLLDPIGEDPRLQARGGTNIAGVPSMVKLMANGGRFQTPGLPDASQQFGGSGNGFTTQEPIVMQGAYTGDVKAVAGGSPERIKVEPIGQPTAAGATKEAQIANMWTGRGDENDTTTGTAYGPYAPNAVSSARFGDEGQWQGGGQGFMLDYPVGSHSPTYTENQAYVDEIMNPRSMLGYKLRAMTMQQLIADPELRARYLTMRTGDDLYGQLDYGNNFRGQLGTSNAPSSWASPNSGQRSVYDTAPYDTPSGNRPRLQNEGGMNMAGVPSMQAAMQQPQAPMMGIPQQGQSLLMQPNVIQQLIASNNKRVRLALPEAV